MSQESMRTENNNIRDSSTRTTVDRENIGHVRPRIKEDTVGGTRYRRPTRRRDS